MRPKIVGVKPECTLIDIAYLMGHASPRTTMIYNNPRLEEMLGQMSATNRSKIVAKTSRAAIADRS
jgi:hypothetical protein